jgi:NAD(P)H-flavin reductase
LRGKDADACGFASHELTPSLPLRGCDALCIVQLLRVMLSSGMESEHRPGVQVSLVFANKSEADILMRSELEEQMSANPQRARLVHVLSSAAPPKESVPQQQMQNWHTRAMRISRQLSPRAAAASDDDDSGDSEKSRSASPPSSSPPPPSPPSNVRVEAGHVNAFVFRRHLFPPATGTLTFVCGPPPMVSATFTHLLALGFADERIVEF